MRVLTLSDGFTTSSAPSAGSVAQNALSVYASDAAFVTGKGSAAANGDSYYNSTYHAARLYQNGAWHFFKVSSLQSFATPAAFVTAKGSAATNGDTFYESTENAIKCYQNGAWHFVKSAAATVHASTAAFVTGKGSAAAEGDFFYDSALDVFRVYQNSSWQSLSVTFSSSQVLCDSPNGLGSTNTKIRRFTNSATIGTDVTYADSATLGATFTINTSGLYAASYWDGYSSGSGVVGISVDANGTVNVDTIPAANRLVESVSQSGSLISVSTVARFSAGQVVRAHCNGSLDFTGAFAGFRIVRIG